MSGFEDHQRNDDHGMDPDQNNEPHAEIGRGVAVRGISGMSEELFAFRKHLKPGREHQEKQDDEEHVEHRGVGGSKHRIGNVSIGVWKRSPLDFLELFAPMRTHFRVGAGQTSPQQRRCEMLHCSSKVYREY
ncbi:MAG TPA: hypothetical protein VGP40_06750 [Chthoniobacterales bacterium]|nr:hypothetical protein [Chthoniobacterales bacterium]